MFIKDIEGNWHNYSSITHFRVACREHGWILRSNDGDVFASYETKAEAQAHLDSIMESYNNIKASV